MDQEKFGQFIKDLRKKNNLTQKQLADKYNVTYQAVSKWENGLNMPDTALIKQMSEDFNISLDDLLNGEYKKKKKRKLLLIIIPIILVIIILFCFLMMNNNDFHFKTLSTTCNNFNINGSISYNENKSAIYITNIEYCGEEDNKTYKTIECILFESGNHTDIKISSYKSKKENIKLDEFLEDLTLSIDNYDKNCDDYDDNSLYLSINATDSNDVITTYKIPLSLATCDAE